MPTSQEQSHHGFTKVPATDDIRAYWIFEREVVRSDNDTRSYRIIRLENELEVILIHDPKTDKAAASMDVNVGHLSDPEDLQGLAHFCEHLLFMGNEKYPSENEYSEYLSKNSGHSNAFTGMDNTAYYFDVHPSALDGALDRFSQFFVSPIFSDSCTEREIRVVDSENSKNLQSDTWRMFQLEKASSSRSHSYWRFGTGNLQTLWERPKALGLDVREELLKFYSRHYSSNVMKLAVLGKESLDSLTRLVVNKFSGVPNKRIVPDRFDGSPFSEKELKKLTFSKMVKDTNLLELTFPVPDQAPYYDTQPIAFISHQVGHEGVGSITSYLKKKGWLNALQSGSIGGAAGFELFKITLDLTEDGLANYKEAVRVVFAYLELLRSVPPQEWAFKEQALLSEIRFKFKSPSSPMSYVTSLAGWMRRPCPRENVLSSVYLTKTFDPKLIEETIEMIRPERCRILLGTQTPIPGVAYDLKEEWYGTEYTIQDFPSDLLQPGTLIDSLALPPPNSFISTNFHVDKRDDIINPTKRPKCVSETSLGRLWHKKDDRWWLPRATVIIMMRNPIINSNCINSLKSHFVTKLLKETLSEQLYEAHLAGLTYEVGTSWDSIIVNVDGYNEKLHLLMETVLEGLKNLKVDPKKFKLVKDEAERRWKNFVLEGPHSHASYWMNALLSHTHYSYEQKLQEINKITPADIEKFIPQILNRGFIESLVHGNLTEQEAKEIVQLPEKIFSFDSVPQDELKPQLPLCIPEGSNYVYERILDNSSNVNSAVEYFIDAGDLANHEIRTRLLLMTHLMQESCFNQLRTKEQLGYIIQSFAKQTPGQCGLEIKIQSERDPRYVEGRIENFLVWFLSEKLEKMSQEEFEEMKTSLINRALEDFKNLWDESSHYWIHISSEYYSFDQRRKDAELLRKITIPEIIEFYKRYIHPSSPSRAKCSTQIRSQHIPIPSDLVLKTSKALDIPIDLTPESVEIMQSKPDIEKLETYMKDKPKGAELIKAIRKETEMENSTDHGTFHKPKIIKDLNEFKSGLRTGPRAVPVDDWKD
ncbi:Metalloenzyme, LuxS/M16 peptidase-like protein [Phakopsora pachyrhizi]|nr:Metalloenzyme, LuxS/M16 peptidase-like protein [Phakopsora pachyrhizi]